MTKILVMLILSLFSLKTFSSEYFCDYKGESGHKGLIQFRMGEREIWAKRDDWDPITLEVLEEAKTHTIFYRNSLDTDGTPIPGLWIFDKKNKTIVWYVLFSSSPQLSYHFSGNCIERAGGS